MTTEATEEDPAPEVTPAEGTEGETPALALATARVAAPDPDQILLVAETTPATDVDPPRREEAALLRSVAILSPKATLLMKSD